MLLLSSVMIFVAVTSDLHFKSCPRFKKIDPGASVMFTYALFTNHVYSIWVIGVAFFSVRKPALHTPGYRRMSWPLKFSCYMDTPVGIYSERFYMQQVMRRCFCRPRTNIPWQILRATLSITHTHIYIDQQSIPWSLNKANTRKQFYIVGFDDVKDCRSPWCSIRRQFC